MVGERTSFEGTLRSDGSIRVLGSVQGEIECKSAVFVDERARVNANISGAQITIAGQVEGQIRCPGRVEIRSTGRVTGEIQAGALIVQEGAFFDGSSRMATASPSAAAAEPSQPTPAADMAAVGTRSEEGTRRP
jgi:cytoskeletal protein CcmA (bactofilin family)